MDLFSISLTFNINLYNNIYLTVNKLQKIKVLAHLAVYFL